jgi:dihydropteroate synthase
LQEYGTRIPQVMGILNVTADSFSDGGRFLAVGPAIAHGHQMIADGADWIDIGGESTRPGAANIPADLEWQRIEPVLLGLHATGYRVSVDTQKPTVMRAAIARGAQMVNDVNALQAEGAVAVCAASDVDVCLMHRQGTPTTMQANPHYDDVVADVLAFLLGRAHACEAAGIAAQRIIIDPGIGFGKTLEHNLALLRALPQFVATGYRVLVGVSRKSLWQHLLGRPLDARLAASLAGAVHAAYAGAAILRVHDVPETVDALKVWAALRP